MARLCLGSASRGGKVGGRDDELGGLHHLLNLISVEDDGLGEELEVVWEIEPGRRLIDEAALPDPARDGFDDPHRLAFLDAVRWGAITSADSRALQAPFRSGIAIEDYQLDPVVRGVADAAGQPADRRRRRPRQDHRGGLVIQELLLRHRTRTVLVVCPGVAADQVARRDGGDALPAADHLDRLAQARPSVLPPQATYPRTFDNGGHSGCLLPSRSRAEP